MGLWKIIKNLQQPEEFFFCKSTILYLIFNFFFYFLKYKNMIAHLQKTWKIQSKTTYSSTIYYHCLSRYMKIFSWSFNVIFSEINRMNVQRSRRI